MITSGRTAGLLAPLAGGLIAFSMPPWGWWPLAFAGVAILDRLLANQPRKERFKRATLVGIWWLYPATFWMWDMTIPGYLIQGIMFSMLYGAVAVLVPPTRGRRVALPAALVVAALVRWNWPFGGVPLASLAISQADAPLAQTARIFGSLTIVALVGVGGVALSALAERTMRDTAIAVGVLLAAAFLAVIAPQGQVIDTIDIAIVQGGGPQNTRAANTSSRAVFERHLDASQDVQGPVDFVLWPENVVHTRGPLVDTTVYDEIVELAQQLDAPIIAGIVETFSDEGFFLNASMTINPDGTNSGRYDKLRRVPFGEFVPFRGLIERLAPDFLPTNDAKPGTGPAIIETGVGTAAISISWEVFHDDRTYDGMNNGGLIQLNPTNGSSFWLTIVQTQQVASSQLRAIESGRWVLQAAPTGFSAIIEPDGTIVERTAISEARVLQGEVELREGNTWATRFTWYPMFFIAFAAYAVAWIMARSESDRVMSTS
ncbi:MAG: apolipoprotein N-acyltransferase [Paracrocinitomix sp.]|jgi:apolipoprotein N-acyltransferase